MRLLLALLLLLNLAAYLLLGPYERTQLLPRGLAGGGGGSGLTLLSEADPVQLQPAADASAPHAASDPGLPAPAPGQAEPPAAAEAGATEPQPPLAAPPRPGRVAICYTLGTLPDRLRVERVLGELGKLGLTAAVRSEERRGDLSGYWVLLPAQPNLGAAQGLMAELQQRGIDSFVVGTGEYRNSVSLGFFHGRRAAEELEARIRAQGYNPRLVLRYRQETQYWLDLDEAASERFSDAHWEALAAAHPMLGRYVRDCG
jgi:hypothetical protein